MKEMVVFKLFYVIFFITLFHKVKINSYSEELNIRIFKKLPVNLRNGPSNKDNQYPIVARIDQNTTFLFLKEIDDWVNIKLLDSKLDVWVKKTMISNRKNITSLKTNSFFFRLPNKERLEDIKKGTLVILIKCYNRFDLCKIINLKTNTRGWVSKQNIWIVSK